MDAGVDVRGNRRLHQESGKEENAPQQQRWSHLWIVSKTHRRPQITLIGLQVEDHHSRFQQQLERRNKIWSWCSSRLTGARATWEPPLPLTVASPGPSRQFIHIVFCVIHRDNFMNAVETELVCLKGSPSQPSSYTRRTKRSFDANNVELQSVFAVRWSRHQVSVKIYFNPPASPQHNDPARGVEKRCCLWTSEKFLHPRIILSMDNVHINDLKVSRQGNSLHFQ